MKSLFRAAAAGLLLLAVSAGAEKKAAPPTHVGITHKVFHPKDRRNWRGDEEKDLRCTVWYPTVETAVETKQVIGPPDAPYFEAGLASPDAPLAPSKNGWPMILLSHGSGGSALQMAWLATALARAGFIAVAVDHPGNNSVSKQTREGLALWWERATDLSMVLDGMLADDQFGKKIDQARIGAAGFSMGGYTVLALAGAQTDISEYLSLCKEDADAAVCHPPELRGFGTPLDILHAVRKTSGESLARSNELFSDERIGAVFAIAPAMAFTMTDDSLREIRLPMELVVGDDDKIAPAKDNASYVRSQVRGAKLTLLPHVEHYTFLDTCTAEGKKKVERYCEDEAGVDRDVIHTRVSEMATSFFDKALKIK